MPSREQQEHQRWCEEQHATMNGNLSKMYARLGKMETLMATHAKYADSAQKELKCLNKWAQKRDGATTALLWVAGISGTVIVIAGAVYKLSG